MMTVEEASNILSNPSASIKNRSLQKYLQAYNFGINALDEVACLQHSVDVAIQNGEKWSMEFIKSVIDDVVASICESSES